MKDAFSYWLPLCEMVSQLRCWVRVTSRVNTLTQEGYWGQLLTMPVEGYLEGPGGPIPLQDVEWVDVSTRLIKGGIAGRSLQLIDVKDEIFSALRGTQLDWELHESIWSKEGIFDEQPVQVFRIANPFGPKSNP